MCPGPATGSSGSLPASGLPSGRFPTRTMNDLARKINDDESAVLTPAPPVTHAADLRPMSRRIHIWPEAGHRRAMSGWAGPSANRGDDRPLPVPLLVGRECPGGVRVVVRAVGPRVRAEPVGQRAALEVRVRDLRVAPAIFRERVGEIHGHDAEDRPRPPGPRRAT